MFLPFFCAEGTAYHVLSKNFLTAHQLDTDLCTEFLCVPCWEKCLSRHACR